MKDKLLILLFLSSITRAGVPVYQEATLEKVADMEPAKDAGSYLPELTEEQKAYIRGLYALKVLQEHSDRVTDDSFVGLLKGMQQEGGYDFDAQDEWGQSFLMFCADHNLLESAKVLRKFGVETGLRNFNGYTAADLAYLKNNSVTRKRIPFLGASELERICGWSDKGAEERSLAAIAGAAVLMSMFASYKASTQSNLPKKPPVQPVSKIAIAAAQIKLHIPLGADLTQPVIVAAYKALAKRYHPDKGGNPEDFKEIGIAKDFLLDAIGFTAITFLRDSINRLRQNSGPKLLTDKPKDNFVWP